MLELVQPEKDTTPPSKHPLLIQGLTVTYAAQPAVFSIDLAIRPGAMTAIVGPNGAGKSTLLK
ncbi:MAG: ATP-binding cassette domain-containing protein, partial [Pseudomonadota bacterium]